MSESSGFSAFLKKQNIEFTWDLLGIKAMGAMAQGLFASLLIGTIINTLGQRLGIDYLNTVVGPQATAATGAAMAIAIGYAMKAPPFVLFSLLGVGTAANAMGGAGGPLAVYFVVVIATYAGMLVSKTTPVDLIITPFVTVFVGVSAAVLMAPHIGRAAAAIGHIIMWATEMQPFVMGAIISFVVGIVLTLPISSAALCAGLGLVGLAGGAALAGCCAHMIGFAVASYRENGVGGLMAQGLGTSMLQMPNLFKKPILWVPAVCASLVVGPIATVVFAFRQNGPPLSSGMGTSGLVGPISVITGWFEPSQAALNFGEVPITPGIIDWLGLILICVVIPAVVAWFVSEHMRKKGLIQLGDLKIDC